jgi:prepilin-type N-terminal cleavage/methylation domain-containing protein
MMFIDPSITRRTGYRAFTLIEVLVVVAIIALLVAILLPSLQRARNQAKAVLCLSNMKQIGSAIYLYAQDTKDYLPPYYFLRPINNNPNDQRNLPFWFQYLPYKYLAGNYEIIICPSDDLKDPLGGRRGAPYFRIVRGGKIGAYDVAFSYGMNANTPKSAKLVYAPAMLPAGYADRDRINPGRLSNLKEPYRFAFMLETADTGLLNPNSPLALFRYPHGGPPTKMNIIFGDAHAEPRDIKTVWPGDFNTKPDPTPKIPDPNVPGGGKFCAFWYGSPTRVSGILY